MDMFGDSDDEVDKTTTDTISRYEQLRKRPKNCGVAIFHEGTEESLLLAVEASAERNNPQSVLEAMDDYCYSRHWMMHIGDIKRKDLDRGLVIAIEGARQRQQPVIVVELGSYCGYSAVHIAMQLAPGDLVISIDSSPKSIEWARRAVNHCGLSDRVALLCSTAKDCIPKVKELALKQLRKHLETSNNTSTHGSGPHVDLLLVDHDKALYYSDLLVFEASGLLQPGAVVVSDNVLSFGQPKQDLLNHVRDPQYYQSSTLYITALEYTARSLMVAATEEEYRTPGTEELRATDSDHERFAELRADVEAENMLCETVDGVEISIRR